MYIHGGSYSLDLFKEIQKRRLVAYFAAVHVKKSLSQKEKKDYFDRVGQMLPIQCLCLRSADDIREYETPSELKEIAKKWLKDPINSHSIEVAASWLINHRVKPKAQRQAWTLQSFLADHIMQCALSGRPINKYASALK